MHVFLATLAACWIAEPEAAPPPRHSQEALCNELFQYVTDKKISSDANRSAAVQLMSAHCQSQRSRFIRCLESDDRGETAKSVCVRVLGKMLSAAAQVTYLHETGANTPLRMPKALARDDTVEVLLRLAADAANAQRWWVADDYVIAIGLARDERAREFLSTLLADKANHSAGLQFHAAVGLANLGDMRGVDWLIDRSDAVNGIVDNAWPRRVSDHRLSTCCVQALRWLSGHMNATSKKDWLKWRAETDSLPPGRTVECYYHPF